MLSGIAFAILAIAVALPLTQSVNASDHLKFIAVNKLDGANGGSGWCDTMENYATKAGWGTTTPTGLVNCSTVGSSGIFSRNSALPHAEIPKSAIQNNDIIKLWLDCTTCADDEHILDVYSYTVHDINTINEVQIRLCDGSTTDSICSTRVIAENP